MVSYALPALVAIGQARFFHRGPWNPAVWLWRRLSVGPSLRVLGGMQPPSGGFLEAVPLTSFVVMSLASTGQADHAVVRHGVSFLLSSVREDGSWPIDVNLAVWNTALATTALAAATGDVGALGCVDWLLQAQQQEVHPFTRSAPGGWGWSDAAGAVPDADDTAAALLALKVLAESSGDAHPGRITAAAAEGIRWLLDLQNEDGGWPTFCRGWGALPFDRSGCDLTAHALRALHAWEQAETAGRAGEAVERGLAYLAAQQRARRQLGPALVRQRAFSGRGKSRLRDRPRAAGLSRPGLDGDRAGAAGRAMAGRPHGPRRGLGWRPRWGVRQPGGPSVEETALAVEALLAAPKAPPSMPPWRRACLARCGGPWGRHREAAPIGFYFAKLWYYEKLYPLLFAVAALGQAIRRSPPA